MTRGGNKRIQIKGFDKDLVISNARESCREICARGSVDPSIARKLEDKFAAYLEWLIVVEPGDWVYFKRNPTPFFYEDIVAEFDGRNRDEILEAWDISRSTLYRIIDKIRKTTG